MPRFGPTIWQELSAAGLDGEAIWLENDELMIGGRFPAEKRPIFDAVVAAHDPNKQLPRIVGPVETAVQALVDEGIIPANKVTSLLNRVRGK